MTKEDKLMSDLANAFRAVLADPEVVRLATEREEAQYYYELGLRKERELGEAAGRAEGKAEGKVEGRVEGKAETVLKLIVLKFGGASETVQARIRLATPEELDRLAEKILFASSVDEMFSS